MKIEKFYTFYLYLTVFITGATVLMLEILGTRIISPYFGSTLYVWSSLISVTIISLAIGYYLGGWIADKKPESNLLYTFVFLIGLSTLIIPKIDAMVLVFANSFGLRLGALVATFILFTIPMILLGLIAPFAIKLKARTLNNIGTTAGSLYAIATVGSFVGAILTGFFLIPLMGIEMIITIFALILFMIAGLWFLMQRKFKFLLILFLVIPLLFISPSVSSDENKVVYSTQSILGELMVVDRGIYRVILVDGGVQSWLKRLALRASSIFENTAKLVFYLNPEIEEVLLVGLGSGFLFNMLEDDFNLTVEAVEIDENIVQVAKEYFDFDGKVFIEDGRYFIRNLEKTYDVVMLDVYAGDAHPIHLFSQESFSEIRQILNEDGVLVIHTNGLIDSIKIKSIYKTLDNVFNNVSLTKRGEKVTATIIFFASDKSFNKDFAKENIKKYVVHEGNQDAFFYIIDNEWIDSLEGGIIITDDYNPLDSWNVDSMEAWRKFTLGYFADILVK